MKTLHDLFVNQLQDAYSAESQIAEALPKMAKAATNPQLKAGFEQHLIETKEQKKRIEQIGKMLNVDVDENTCEATEGLVEEGGEIISSGLEPDAKDAGLICAGQKVEHYETSLYGTLCAWAKQLNLTEAGQLLHKSLEEEKATNEKLTRLAETMVNAPAAGKA